MSALSLVQRLFSTVLLLPDPPGVPSSALTMHEVSVLLSAELIHIFKAVELPLCCFFN